MKKKVENGKREYFIRHTGKLAPGYLFINKAYTENFIAIQFPHDAHGKLNKKDNPSTNPNDYKGQAKGAMKAFSDLANDGGYVWADYSSENGSPKSIIGEVKLGSNIIKKYDTWKTKDEQARVACLKTIKLVNVRKIPFGKLQSLRDSFPRLRTVSRLKKADGKLKEFILTGSLPKKWGSLSVGQQEAACAEYLRHKFVNGLSPLKFLTLPVGRTRPDIDIIGISKDGKEIFAQVTFTESKKEKIKKLEKYKEKNRYLVFFRGGGKQEKKDGIFYIPRKKVESWLLKAKALGHFIDRL